MKIDCPNCGGTGTVDSGGFTPWGSPIDLPCPVCKRFITGADWEKDSSLEKWFPITAQEINKLRRVVVELIKTSEQFKSMAADRRQRANGYPCGNVMHTQHLAEAKTMEACAYALDVALKEAK